MFVIFGCSVLEADSASFFASWLQFVNLQVLPWTKQSKWLQPALASSPAEGLFGVQWTRKKERKREQIMFSTRTDAIVNIRLCFLRTDFAFPVLSVLYDKENHQTMVLQNVLTPASFVWHCTAQSSQWILLRNNRWKKGTVRYQDQCCNPPLVWHPQLIHSGL